MATDRREVLQRRWVHAHEEDTSEELVFRPAEHPLPRSRGRRALELRADGSFAETTPGASDVPEDADGTWELENDERIVLAGGAAGAARVLVIVAADEQRLVIGR